MTEVPIIQKPVQLRHERVNDEKLDANKKNTKKMEFVLTYQRQTSLMFFSSKITLKQTYRKGALLTVNSA